MKTLLINLSSLFFIFLMTVILYSCSNNNNKADAYGNFEATEIIVSAEASGQLLRFEVTEGQTINSGDNIGVIDSSQLHLKRLQLIEQKGVMETKFSSIAAQEKVLEQQKQNSLFDKQRFEKLVQNQAVPEKQLDDISNSIKVLDKQINSIRTQNTTVQQEVETINAQINEISNQVSNTMVINPVTGTVLLKLSEQGEVVSFGKPLYKIADLSEMILRAYISGNQLPQIKLDQKVKVLIDNGNDGYKEYEGTVVWIASQAEFTPKIIQTKEERVNLVYAIKIKVKNDGSLKIGMPGEVKF